MLSRIEKIEKQLSKIPDPFVLEYRVPGEDEYNDLGTVLTDIYIRLNRIEDKLQ